MNEAWPPREVPDHWDNIQLIRVARLGTGHTPSRSVPEYWENCTIPWLTVSDLGGLDDSDEVVTDTGQSISERGLANSAAVLLPAGTVALSRTASVGYSVILGRDMAMTQGFVAWTCGPRLKPRYLLYQLRAMRPYLKAIARGSTHTTIFFPDVKALRVLVPPVREQELVVAWLDPRLRRIDQLVEKKRRLIELLEEERIALISYTVTKGLDPSVELKDSGIPWLGDIPAHWSVYRLKQLLSEPLAYGASEAAQEEDPDHPRYIRTTDVTPNGELRAETFKSLPPEIAQPYMLEDGDLLLTRSGATVGKSFLYRNDWGPSCFAGYLIRARFDRRVALPRFAHLFMQTTEYWGQIAEASIQATIQNVSAERYANLRLPVPPTSEQREIVKSLDRRLASLDSAILSLATQLDKLAEYRQALITAAVTGQIDVATEADGREEAIA